MADTNNAAQYTEEAVGAGHPSKAQVIDRHSTACHDDFGRHKWIDGGNVASASSISVPDDSNYFTVTGTTTVTAIAANTAGSTAIDTGVVVKVKFSGALSLTHNATSFIMPQGQNLSISAGDFCEFIHLGSGNWACLSYSGFATTRQAYRRRINHNGGPVIWQRGTSFTSATSPANNDDTYTADGWILLSDGNDIVDISRGTDVLTGGLFSVNATVQTANKKFGFLIPIEQMNVAPIIGDVVSVGFDMSVTSAAAGRLDNIKAVVLSWSSTADAITSDVVSAWDAEDITPTWAANWTAENTPANLGVTSSVARYTINNIAIDTASTKDVALFIWSDGFSGTVGDVLTISNVQLEKGPVATEFEWWHPAEELGYCQRYFHRDDGTTIYHYIGSMYSATSCHAMAFHPTTMRIAPTITASSAGALQVLSNGAGAATSSAISTGSSDTKGALLIITVGALTSGDAASVRTATGSYIDYSAEL